MTTRQEIDILEAAVNAEKFGTPEFGAAFATLKAARDIWIASQPAPAPLKPGIYFSGKGRNRSPFYVEG